MGQTKKGVWESQMCVRGAEWVEWLHRLSGVQEGGEVRKNAWKLQGCIYILKYASLGRKKYFQDLKSLDRLN